jgi:hypothetical protein
MSWLKTARAARHHAGVADSLRSQPRSVRAARRARFPVVRERPPAHGRHHPASAADVRAALRCFGEQAWYGVRLVELRPAPAGRRVALGRLTAPGEIVLYDQPYPPWRLGAPLTDADAELLRRGGADLALPGVVDWPGDTLRDFMLGRVLAHELGHHMLQHERRLRGERAARTREHELRADAIAAALRARLEPYR